MISEEEFQRELLQKSLHCDAAKYDAIRRGAYLPICILNRVYLRALNRAKAPLHFVENFVGMEKSKLMYVQVACAWGLSC